LLDKLLVTMVKIIFIGDVIGKIGRRALAKHLPVLKEKYKPDVVIANAENIAHGIGFTVNTLAEASAAGVDVFTSGNHTWGKSGSDKILNQKPPIIIRPANHIGRKSGVGKVEINIGQNKLIVINLLGKVFISENLHSPFKVLEKLLKKHKNDMVLVDFHAEATSEKNALGQYFDGRVSAVLGTHTHVPTADNRVLAGGTGYITDIGMVGYYDSVIGSRKDQIFNLFLEKGKSSKKHDAPDIGKCQFNAVYLEIDPKTNKTTKIKRLDKIVNIK
jgi:metallophosphoesterase (TIGR00282 family)